MKWVFRNVGTIARNEILKVELKIGSTLYTVKFIKRKGVIAFYEFKTKNNDYEASKGLFSSLVFWKDLMFSNKSFPNYYASERFYYLKKFEESEVLKEFFEFEKVIDNQLTLDVAENSMSKEIEELVKEIELQTAINIALDNGDKETFMLLTNKQEVTT